MDEVVRVWPVERTYSDDELNLIILTYATLDGHRYFRKERERYAAEASRMADEHAPDDVI